MSVRYIPVQWNPNKWAYDAILIAAAGLYLWIFLTLTPAQLAHDRPITPQIHQARAFGSCAFLMLTVILCIGPLARLDERFLPLLYNRRHFGVLTLLVALTHATLILDWYFAFSTTPKLEALLTANTAYTRALGFPFEALGIFALLTLMILAFTSHDFWLKFLTPRLWKRLHLLIYPGYAALVGHVALGALQSPRPALTATVLICATTVSALHLAALLKDREDTAPNADWVPVGPAAAIPEGRAITARLPNGDRVAIFRHEGALSAISNACAHQNGPLGEGRILGGCVTCPWHGFQYDVRTGRSPAPFTEKVPTYRLRLNGDMVEVDPNANPPGTPVDPVPAP